MKTVNVHGVASSRIARRRWYRAVNSEFASNPLGTTHTLNSVSKFGNKPVFPLLYLAPDPRTALFEVQALLGAFYGPSVPNPASNFFIITVHVKRIDVLDLRSAVVRHTLDTDIAGLTGDWWGYRLRLVGRPGGTVRPSAPAHPNSNRAYATTRP